MGVVWLIFFSLYEAARMLVEHKIHRLPVIDGVTGNALYILTHKRLLHYLYHNVSDVLWAWLIFL